MRMPLVLTGVAVLLVTGLITPNASAEMMTCALQGVPDGLTTSLPATLSVTEADGTVVSADGTGYQVCVTPNGTRAYSIVVALSDNIEDLGTDNLTRIFTIGFTLPEGTAPTSAELYGDVTSYTIGANGRDVSLVITPVATTSGTAGANPEPLQDSRARITGGIRYQLAGDPLSNTAGMWIGASASGYVVSMSGSCPPIGNGGGGSPTTTSSLSVRMFAPHFTAGTFASPTVNKGSLRAFFPTATASTCFNGAAVADIVHALEVSRIEAGTPTETDLDRGADFTVSEVAGGLLVTVPEVTFSSPTYRFTASKAVKAAASATRSGKKVTVTVTVPWSLRGKSLVIAEKIGSSYVTVAQRNPSTGVRSYKVSVQGAAGKAKLRLMLNGKVIASPKV